MSQPALPFGGARVVLALEHDGLWSWSCSLDGATTGPWPGYASEDLARAAAECWYPLPVRA